MNPVDKYFLNSGKVFRRRADGVEERFDAQQVRWVNVTPAISDWEFNMDTGLEEISIEAARDMVPEAF